MSGIPAGAGQLLGKRLGKFEILALLALGGTAEIYLARIAGAAGFEKFVVVKCLHDHLADDAEFVKMFLDEARLAAHLDHSNIVQTMELGEHEGRYYMVMEFLAGLSLAMIVRRVAERLPSARIPVPLVLNILAQASAGLHYAHEKTANGKALNIVHRDISPQNLVISFEGVVKLVDFGIAKAEMRETRTRSGTIKGKFAYMSPEQCVANNVDRRTDVFALGVIGHELLTGRRLFKRPSPYETYQAVMECDVKPPSSADPQIDRALDHVIMRAITKDKADRYPSAEAFGDALLGYLHHRGIGSGPGDVSRFFEAHFGLELDEHSGRMRELIAGRDLSADTGVSWGGDDGRDSDPSLSDLSAGSSGDLTTSRRGGSGLASLIDELGGGSRGEVDDEMPAERTRIEANPLERINELERLAAGATASADGPTQLAPSSAVPLPPPPPGVMAAAGMPGKFPDPSSLPTMIAGPDPPVLGGPPLVPGAAGAAAAGARAQLAPLPVAISGTPASGAPAGAGSSAQGAPGISPGMPVPHGTPPRPQSASSQPSSYPVMSAEMSAQIASGASVFPGELRGSGAHGAQPPPGMGGDAGPPGAGMPPGGAPGPGMHGPGMHGPGMHGVPGVDMRPGMPGHGMPGVGMQPGTPGHGMPFAGMQPGMPGHGMPGVGMHPGMPGYGMPGAEMPGPGMPQHGMHGAGPGMPPGYPMPGAMFDPQRAADLMSPVGQQYSERVDWAAMAARRARAVTTWRLAALFVGAIGVALLLTVLVARLIH